MCPYEVVSVYRYEVGFMHPYEVASVCRYELVSFQWYEVVSVSRYEGGVSPTVGSGVYLLV